MWTYVPIGDNHKECVRQQVESHPVVEDLHIMVDKPSYKELGYPTPVKVCTVVE